MLGCGVSNCRQQDVQQRPAFVGQGVFHMGREAIKALLRNKPHITKFLKLGSQYASGYSDQVCLNAAKASGCCHGGKNANHPGAGDDPLRDRKIRFLTGSIVKSFVPPDQCQ